MLSTSCSACAEVIEVLNKTSLDFHTRIFRTKFYFHVLRTNNMLLNNMFWIRVGLTVDKSKSVIRLLLSSSLNLMSIVTFTNIFVKYVVFSM